MLNDAPARSRAPAPPLWRCRSGAIGVMAALWFAPLLGLAALAIELARLAVILSALEAGVAAASFGLSTASGGSAVEAERLVALNLGDLRLPQRPVVSLANGVVTASIACPLPLLRAFGAPPITLVARSDG